MFVPSFKFGRASLSNKFCVNLPSKIVSVLAALSGRKSPWRRRGTQNKQINYITKRVLSHNYKKNAYTAHNTHNTLHTCTGFPFSHSASNYSQQHKVSRDPKPNRQHHTRSGKTHSMVDLPQHQIATLHQQFLKQC